MHGLFQTDLTANTPIIVTTKVEKAAAAPLAAADVDPLPSFVPGVPPPPPPADPLPVFVPGVPPPSPVPSLVADEDGLFVPGVSPPPLVTDEDGQGGSPPSAYKNSKIPVAVWSQAFQREFAWMLEQSMSGVKVCPSSRVPVEAASPHGVQDSQASPLYEAEQEKNCGAGAGPQHPKYQQRGSRSSVGGKTRCCCHPCCRLARVRIVR